MGAASEPVTSGRAPDMAHVLAPLDGSARSESVLSLLRQLPVGRVTLLHVREPDSPDAAGGERYLADVVQRLAPPGREVELRVVVGEPAESIVAAAADVDLVVMSTRGAGGGGRRLFGSVADVVARHSPTPTLLLRGGSAPVTASAVQRVVVPLDGSAAAERALPVASRLASGLSCDLHLVTVADPADDADRTATDADAYLDHCVARVPDEPMTITTEQRIGAPASELLDAVAEGDLLVMTTHGQGAARRWQIGRVAEKLLRQAAAPVVLVRPDSA